MIKNERQDKITEIINQEGYVTAEQLAKKLYVSLPTVRRDLAELAVKGYIIRSRGGACRLEEGSAVPFRFRSAFLSSEKKHMCREAAKLIHDGDCVFLDSSTSVSHMIEYFRELRDIKVVTSSIPLLLALLESGIEVYGTGGREVDITYSFGGGMAEDAMRRFRFDIAFISSTGVSSDGSICELVEPTARLARVAIEQSKKFVYLCGSEKFGISAPHIIADIRAADCVITDEMPQSGLSEEVRLQLAE